MPRVKPLKTLFVETILFIGLFALMGHLSVTFWERYVIQTELSKMKTSLHTLKETINNIGVAYDHLHNELIHLAEIAEKNPLRALTGNHRKPPDKHGSNINSHSNSLSICLSEKFVDDVILEDLPDYEESNADSIFSGSKENSRSVSTWSTHDKETQCKRRKTGRSNMKLLKTKNNSLAKGKNKKNKNICPENDHSKCLDVYRKENEKITWKF